MDQRERDRRALEVARLCGSLAQRGVVLVALPWVDNGGVVRTKAVPLDRLERAATWGVGASPVFDAFTPDDTIVSGRYAGSPIGDLRLVPDLDRLTVLAAQPGWAWAPVHRYTQDGDLHPQDARATVRRAVAQLADEGLTAKAAFEIEWVVGADEDDFVPATRGPAYGFTRIVEKSNYLIDLVAALQEQGVRVEQIHPEYAAGQFEVSVAAEDPLGAADTSVLVRETIRAITIRHGMRVSFAPSVDASGVGSGGHVHLSLWWDGRNLHSGGDGPCGLTDTAEAFAAGILEHLPGLLAVGAPSPASYLRLVPGRWAASFQACGHENRETAVRLVTGSGGEEDRAANLEVKVLDLSANPYLCMAGLLFAGIAGIRGGLTLPDLVDVDPASLTEADRRRRGILRLPRTLAEATDAFESDAVLTDAFGTELSATIVDVHRAEITRFTGATDEEIAAALRWAF
ncbi:glutamine synthetase family protein [Rhodococcus spongiicola]|uniref:Glutamine synthetase n=1 Tax=Rhodococcus spongiicola TaxID=2487352 RepID=A0A438AUN7_9NOCA|nr:glutamine synthetase family protein [Rhodococcus spongiicola]RVW02461.1 glutamine synthetase [Rhodococcus spongiicola]